MKKEIFSLNYNILDFIAQKNTILGKDEVRNLAFLAKKRGVACTLAHPKYGIDEMSIDMQKRLANQEVMCGRCFHNCENLQLY